MARIKRITANLPEDLLSEAMKVTGRGLTETLVEELKLIKCSAAFEKARVLRGKLGFRIDLDLSRERHRH